jgi:hypothetical protein
MLARRLEVPLPYLLYRAQTRYEQDLRGLQDVRGALSPPTPQAPPRANNFAGSGEQSPVRARSSVLRLSGAPLGVRARLNSLGTHSAARAPKGPSESVLTLRREPPLARRAVSPPSSGSDSEAEEAAGAERAEVQDELERKLAALQAALTSDALGLVSSVRARRPAPLASPSPPHPAAQRQDSSSQSLSGASSARGSIPDMPSPPPEPQSPVRRQFSPPRTQQRLASQAASPTARQQPLLRYGGLMKPGAGQASARGSNYGSSASSFSDISGGLCLALVVA